MTEFLRSWLLGIVCAAFLGALAESLTPEGRMRKICRLAGGLVLVLAALGPVARLDLQDTALMTMQRDPQAHSAADSLEDTNIFLQERIIAEKTAAYIVDKAEGLGMTCEAAVTVTADERGALLPTGAVLKGAWTAEQQLRLAEILTQELGLMPEQVSYERAEP